MYAGFRNEGDGCKSPSGQLPTCGEPFCAGFARVKASSHSGEVAEPARPEGLLGDAAPYISISAKSSPKSAKISVGSMAVMLRRLAQRSAAAP